MKTAIGARNNKQRIFVISNLGMNENYGLNAVRLNKVLLKLSLMGIKDEQVVIAIGKRVSVSAGEVSFCNAPR